MTGWWNEQDVLESLRDILGRVLNDAGSDFAGLGVLISDHPECLPIISLRAESRLSEQNSLASALIELSRFQSEYHDGFHVVSTFGKLLLVSQYFSPPIVPGINFNRTKRLGGRYVAALFGSCLPAVAVSGIATRAMGVVLFQRGLEIGSPA